LSPLRKGGLRGLIPPSAQPADCVYFDDSQANIQTTNELGIKSYLFTDTEDIKNILIDLNHGDTR